MSMVGKVMVFKGDAEYADAETIVEVTEVKRDGTAEVAFDIPGKNLRAYLTINVGELVAQTIAQAIPEER